MQRLLIKYFKDPFFSQYKTLTRVASALRLPEGCITACQPRAVAAVEEQLKGTIVPALQKKTEPPEKVSDLQRILQHSWGKGGTLSYGPVPPKGWSPSLALFLLRTPWSQVLLSFLPIPHTHMTVNLRLSPESIILQNQREYISVKIKK